MLKTTKLNKVQGRISGIGWRGRPQQQKRPLRMVETRSYTTQPKH